MTSRSALTGFLIGSTVSLALSVLWNRYQTKSENSESNEKPTKANESRSVSIPESLREEQLSRHTLYFGEEGMAKLRNAKVVVVGLGGVGSHTAHMLARAGVGHLRMIDFDQVSLSSLNRHACATLKDVGTPKATCLKKFCQQLCPDPSYLFMEDIIEMYTVENGPELLEGHDWDLVIDAIDDVPTKAALLAHCINNKLRVISCMGAGGKSDMTRLHISDLRTATRDPLASKLRQSLKKLLKDKDQSFLDDMNQVSIVYSSEKTVVKLADFTDQQKDEGVHQFGAVDGMRIRIIPVLGTMPAIMGQALAAAALCEIGQKPFSPVTGERLSRNVRHRMIQRLKQRELRIQQAATKDEQIQPIPETGCLINGKTWVGPLQIDADDVEYLLEVWRNRCAVTGARLGTVIELVRWDILKPSVCQNLVLMSTHAIKEFDEKGIDSVPEHVQSTITNRLKSCRVDAYA